MRAVILAGGRGTRIESAFPERPKPLIPVDGVPVIERQIAALKQEGVREFTVVTGYKAELLETALGDGGRFGVDIRYYRERAPMGTAGALGRLGLKEDFLLLSGDIVFSCSLARLIGFHRKRGALATLFAHPNSHPSDSSLLLTGPDGRVTAFLPKEDRPADAPNLCNAGIQLLSPKLLERLRGAEKADLDRDVLRPAVRTGGVFACRSAEYVKDMGTPERLAAVERDLQAGLPERLRFDRPKPAVFLDRDGTLNVYRGFITDPDGIALLPGAAAAVRRLNRQGILAIVVTNQAVVARGECSLETLSAIHDRLETLLGLEGAYLDGIFVCPHHPDGGFAGEVPALKRACDCRKPAPGLLLRAAETFGVDLAASWMVGDTPRDVQTAKNAGCRAAYLRCGKPGPAPEGAPAYGDLAAFVAANF